MGFFFTLDSIDILCLVYLNFTANKLIFKVQKQIAHSFEERNIYKKIGILISTSPSYWPKSKLFHDDDNSIK